MTNPDSLSPSAAPLTSAEAKRIYDFLNPTEGMGFLEEHEPVIAAKLRRIVTCEAWAIPETGEAFVIRTIPPASPLPDTPGVSDPKLKELIDAHQNAAYHISEVARRVHTKEEESEAWGRMDKSRSSLEDYFRTLQRENERLKAKATSFLVTATEKSTARTEARASSPVRALLDDVRDALSVTVDVKGLNSLTAIEKQIAALLSDNERLRSQWEGLAWHGCLTGDCPHDTQAECDASLANSFRETVAEDAGFMAKLRARSLSDETPNSPVTPSGASPGGTQ